MSSLQTDHQEFTEFSLSESLTQFAKIKGNLPDLRTPLAFRFASGVAALSVLIVALAYLVLVGGLAWLGLEYLVSHVRLLGSENSTGSVLFYIVISLIFLFFLLFLVKPLFRIGDSELKPRVLSRAEQPDLYRYVEAMCDALDTPRPHRIQVAVDSNASASLHGFAWGIFSRKPVLTLGLTLVNGIDLTRLTGIMAHELAHFTQHGGMRFNRIVNSVNYWFARVVYEQDAFDLKLLQLSALPLLGLIFRMLGWVVTAGRIVLWLFMMLAHASTGIVSRRGEYDADRYMAAMIGSTQVAPTLHRVALLDAAMNATSEDLALSISEHRLVDSIPALSVARAKRVTPERKEQMLRLMKLQGSGWFDTHPSLVQRSRAARRLRCKAKFTARGQARDLFRNFDKLSKQQSLELYKVHLRDKLPTMTIVPTCEIVEEIDAAQRSEEALGRFYQGKALMTRPILPGPDAMTPPRDYESAVALQASVRQEMTDAAPDFHKEIDRLIRIDDRLKSNEMGEALVKAGFEIDPIQFQLIIARPVPIAQSIAARRRDLAEQEAVVEVHEDVIRQRLCNASQLIRSTQLRETVGAHKIEETLSRIDRLQVCSPCILEALPLGVEMAGLIDALVVMVQSRGQSRKQRQVNKEIKSTTARINEILHGLRRDYDNIAYPFAHGDAGTTLSQFFVESMPKSEDPIDLVFVAGETIARLETMLTRSMATFAELAESAEKALGFANQIQPQEEDEFESLLIEAERGGNRQYDAAESGAWLPAFAAAAMVAIGVLLGVYTAGVATPTVTSHVVPHHANYQPTIVPAVMVVSPQGPSYDPFHFFTPAVQQPVVPNYNPGFGPNQPGNYYPPGHPNYIPNQPNNVQPGYPGNPNFPNTQPNRNQPNIPGHRQPPQPNRGTPGRPTPNRPSPPQPYRPGPSGPSGPSSPGLPGGF